MFRFLLVLVFLRYLLAWRFLAACGHRLTSFLVGPLVSRMLRAPSLRSRSCEGSDLVGDLSVSVAGWLVNN